MSGTREVTDGGKPAGAQGAAQSSQRKQDIRPDLEKIDRLLGGEVGSALKDAFTTFDHNIGVDMATVRAEASAASGSAAAAASSAEAAAGSLRSVQETSDRIAENVEAIMTSSHEAETSAGKAAQSAEGAKRAAVSVKDALKATVSGETADGQPATSEKEGKDLIAYMVRLLEENRSNVGRLLDRMGEAEKELGTYKPKDGEASDEKPLREQVQELASQVTGFAQTIDLFKQILQMAGVVPQLENDTSKKEGEA